MQMNIEAKFSQGPIHPSKDHPSVFLLATGLQAMHTAQCQILKCIFPTFQAAIVYHSLHYGVKVN